MNFEEKFKSYNNVQLLNIIENPNDYQASAIEAAKKIFAERKLSDKELEIAKTELTHQQHLNIQKKQKQEALANKIHSIKNTVFDHLNPVPTASRTPERIVKGISILFGVLFVLQLVQEFNMSRPMFISRNADWGFKTIFHFLPLIVLPTTTILFALHKKTGWILMISYSMYSAISSLGLFMMAIKLQGHTLTVIDNLFPQPPAMVYLSVFLLFTAVIFVVCRSDIREIFQVRKKSMLVTLGLALAISVILNYRLLIFNFT